MERSLVRFQSQADAQKVVEQLPEARMIDNQVYCSDKPALELAIALAQVSDYQWQRMPYPEAEFEYNGDNPRIYVRCLSAYNNGYLHGLWINAAQHINDIQDKVNWMLSWSPVANVEACEEWAVHDYEGFGNFSLREWESLETVSKLANTIKENGEALAAYVACEFPNLEEIEDWNEVVEQFQSAYVGHFESEKDFALTSEEIEEVYNFKALQEQFPFWANNINWEAVATDLFCTDYYQTKATAEGYGIYVFRNCK